MKWLIGFQQCHTIHIIHLLRIPRLFASRALDPCQRSNVPYQHLWPQRELMLQGMVGVQNDGSKWFKCMKFLCFKDAGGGFFDLFATSFTGKKKNRSQISCCPLLTYSLAVSCKSSLSDLKTLPSICVGKMPLKSSDSGRHEITLRFYKYIYIVN